GQRPARRPHRDRLLQRPPDRPGGGPAVSAQPACLRSGEKDGEGTDSPAPRSAGSARFELMDDPFVFRAASFQFETPAGLTGDMDEDLQVLGRQATLDA